jgi:exonuclease VII large subunit
VSKGCVGVRVGNQFVREHRRSLLLTLLSPCPPYSAHDRAETNALLRQLLANQEQTLANQEQTLANQEQTLANQEQTLANQEQTLANQEQTLIEAHHTRRLLEMQAGEDVASAATPVFYEEQARTMLRDVLRFRCGLKIVHGDRVHRLHGEIPAYAELEVESVEWDFRAFVAVDAGPVPYPGKTADFIIYPDHAAYRRPPALIEPRHLSPLKVPLPDDTLGLVACDYVAIFETTTSDNWNKSKGARKSLLQRLEERLRVTLERAKSVSPMTTSISDVVAVVGVVSPFSCQRSMVSDVAAFPLLAELLDRSRFVFVNQSLVLPAVGRNAGAGGPPGGGVAAAAALKTP